jgi:hypothetical protein
MVFAQAALSVLLETRKSHWRDPEYGHRLNRLKPIAVWAKENHRPLVIVLGSSRVEMGFVPEQLPTSACVFNFAQSGCGPVGQFLKLERLINSGIKPDYVLVEVLRPLWGETGSISTQIGNEPQKYTLPDFRQLKDRYTMPASYWVSRANSFSAFRANLIQHAGLESWLPPDRRTTFLWKSITPLGAMPYHAPNMSGEERSRRTAVAQQQYVQRLKTLTIHSDVEWAYAQILPNLFESWNSIRIPGHARITSIPILVSARRLKVGGRKNVGVGSSLWCPRVRLFGMAG